MPLVLDRRAALRLGFAAVAAPTLLAAGSARPPLDPRRVPRFAVDLPLPRVLRPTTTGGGVDRYVVTQRGATRQLLPPGCRRTPVWGYDGEFPGPTIVARRGRPVEVRQSTGCRRT